MSGVLFEGGVMVMQWTSIRSVLACSILLVVFGGLCLCTASGQAPGQGSKPGPRDDVEQQRGVLKEAMAKKLKLTHQVVTALSTQDFPLLADSANALKQVAEDTVWKVSPNVTFVKYGAEFATIADELARRAREKDLNGVTLSYIRLTINCVECHKFSRDNRIYGPRP